MGSVPRLAGTSTYQTSRLPESSLAALPGPKCTSGSFCTDLRSWRPLPLTLIDALFPTTPAS
jgi:hypothetical protein